MGNKLSDQLLTAVKEVAAPAVAKPEPVVAPAAPAAPEVHQVNLFGEVEDVPATKPTPAQKFKPGDTIDL